jgi:hypothetical protein
MLVGWGPEQTFLYNDAYISVLSLAKHPQALSLPVSEVWAEIWDFCEPLADKFSPKERPGLWMMCASFMNRDFVEETYYPKHAGESPATAGTFEIKSGESGTTVIVGLPSRSVSGSAKSRKV